MKLKTFKLTIFLFIFFIVGKNAVAQKAYKDYYPFLVSFAYVTYNDDLFSNQVIENRNGFIYSATGYFKEHGYMRFAVETSSGKLKEPINIEAYQFEQSEIFSLRTWDVNFGYKKDFWKGFQIAVYSGMNFLEFALEKEDDKEYRTKIGIPFGLNLDWKYQLGKKTDFFISAYVNNSITYSRLYKANENFGKSYYAFEIGLGLAKSFKTKEQDNNTERKKME